MKPLLIGECPGRAGGLPLEGAIGRRIAELAGLTFTEYLERTERVNLFVEPQPMWSATKARFQAWSLVASVTAYAPWDHRVVLLLGRRVTAAFGLGQREWLLPLTGASGTWVACPHPSGRNRWYNHLQNRERLAAFLREALGATT